MAQVCALCGGTGKNGAQWLVLVAGQQNARVHKPCGEKLVVSAPEGVLARLIPSSELKARWQAERAERNVRSFWEEKFSQAKALPHISQEVASPAK